MRRKHLILAVVGAVLLSAFTIALFSGAFTPKPPAGWSQVQTGMTRAEVLALVGTPQQSGWPENIAETWQVDGLVSHRRLFIVYDGERVQNVWEGTWVRGYGWVRPRRESR
jgi:hypothetical protein